MTTAPSYLDIYYTVDRIRFISKRTIEEQKCLIPVAELEQHCTPHHYNDRTGQKVEELVWHNDGNKGRATGYITSVQAIACDDYFVDIIKDYDAGTLSYIEIAQDIVFNTMPEAEAFGEQYGLDLRKRQRLNENWVYPEAKASYYIGKADKDDHPDNYAHRYPRMSKIIEGKAVYRTEFRITGAAAITRCLKLHQSLETGAYPLPSAYERWTFIANRYYVYRGQDLPSWKQFTEVKKVKFGSLYVPRQQLRRIRDRLNNTNNNNT
jgi:hypothetical protein